MADKKKKISELPLIKSLIGLYTIGVDAANNSGKVSLEWLQNAYENVLTAITNANKATTIANTAADIANKAATNADSRMVQISENVNLVIADTEEARDRANTATGEADAARVSLSESVQQKLTEVDNKMLTVKDGKTPVLDVGNVQSGEKASASVVPAGEDSGGNPKYNINLTLPKGDNGLPPVIETGTITTGEPGTEASATLVPDGQTEGGNPKYLLNLTIPRGSQGIPGVGSGNVSASATGLVTGKKYLFVPGANGSTVGTFVEYVAPTIPTKTSDLENDKDFTTSNAVTELLLGYVQKVAGKGLSTEDFTTELKNKLSALSNYDDTDIQAAVTSLQTQLNTLLSGNASTAIESFNEIIAFLANVEDTQTLAGIIAGINTAIADVQASIPTKYSQLQNDNNTVQDANYVHTDNNYTTTDKDKLSGIQAGAQVNPGIATPSANGLMSAGDKTILDRQESYTTASTVASLNPAYRYIYVTLSSNASLSVSGTGTSYNGRSITAYVYCSSARTIAIPTTGSYVSMCGSSYTCPAGKWVEFNLECINGIWHIAKLEQE